MRISRSHLEEIWRHARETLPEECCGLLLGRKKDEEVVIEEVRRARNVHPRDRKTCYLIDPVEYLWAERDAEKKGLEIVGVYHSHPGIEPKPSSIDFEEAIPSYIYLIISLKDSENVKAWRFKGDVKGFSEEKLEIV